MPQGTVSPNPGQRLTRDVEVRGVEVLPWRQRHITTVLHFPVLAVVAAARSEVEKKREKGVEVWPPDWGLGEGGSASSPGRKLTWCV